MEFERDVFTFDASAVETGDGLIVGSMRGRAAPYGVPNGRPGIAWRINDAGQPELIEYAGTIWEPGAFSDWLAGDGAKRVRFLFQHGDANESWYETPMGVNSLPLGPVNAIQEAADGLYVDCSFTAHELGSAVFKLLQTGALSEMSICSAMVEADYRPGEDGQFYRHGVKAELWDVSVVVWGQQGLNAAVTELYSLAPSYKAARDRAADYMPGVTTEPVTDEPATSTVVAVLGAGLYDVLTDTAQDWLEDGVITVDEFVPLSTLITSLVSALDAGLDEIGIADRSVPAPDCDDEEGEMDSHRGAREREAGAQISAANAEPLRNAAAYLRQAADHADALEGVVTSGTYIPDEESRTPPPNLPEPLAGTDQAERNAVRLAYLRMGRIAPTVNPEPEDTKGN